jgi:hypothetical protein
LFTLPEGISFYRLEGIFFYRFMVDYSTMIVFVLLMNPLYKIALLTLFLYELQPSRHEDSRRIDALASIHLIAKLTPAGTSLPHSITHSSVIPAWRPRNVAHAKTIVDFSGM